MPGHRGCEGDAGSEGAYENPFAPERQEEVAWAAGLFEGEGCFNVYTRKSGKLQIQCLLGSTDRDVVERFAKVIGFGSARERSVAKDHYKPFFEWRIYEAERVREFIAMVYPWLGERRRAKADDVLARGASIEPHYKIKTHCKNGHPYEGDNLILEPYMRDGKRFFARRCRECRSTQERDRARKRLGITPDRWRK